MSYVRIIFVIFVLGFGLLLFQSGMKVCNQLDFRCRTMTSNYNSEKFIAESFRKTCRGNGFANLNEWQMNCKEMFSLDYIGWSNACEFMDVSMKNSNQELFYGIWKNNGETREVYCRKRRSYDFEEKRESDPEKGL